LHFLKWLVNLTALKVTHNDAEKTTAKTEEARTEKGRQNKTEKTSPNIYNKAELINLITVYGSFNKEQS